MEVRLACRQSFGKRERIIQDPDTGTIYPLPDAGTHQLWYDGSGVSGSQVKGKMNPFTGSATFPVSTDAVMSALGSPCPVASAIIRQSFLPTPKKPHQSPPHSLAEGVDMLKHVSAARFPALSEDDWLALAADFQGHDELAAVEALAALVDSGFGELPCKG